MIPRPFISSSLRSHPNSRITSYNVCYTKLLRYVVGLLALLAVIQLLPRILRLDLAQTAREVAVERGLIAGRRRTTRTPIIRAYRITPEAAGNLAGRSLRELGLFERHGLFVDRIKRGGEVFIPDSETVMQAGDEVV